MFNKFKKLAAVCAALTLTFVFAATPVSAATSEVTAKPGETVTVKLFNAKGEFGVEGEISYDNKGLFSDVSVDSKGGLGGEMTSDAVFLYSGEEGTGSVKLKVTVKSDAQAGDKCVITFPYETADRDGNMVDSGVNTITVKVEKKSSSDDKDDDDDKKPSTPSATPAPVVKSDLTEANRLIAMVGELNKADYTSDSWNALIAALNKVKALTVYTPQAEVDAAVAALQAAIDGLVKIDYTALRAAIDAAEALKSDSEFAALWNELLAALANAMANLEGTSQEEVDASAAALADIVARIQAYLAGLTEAPVVQEPIEEPVEGCGVPFHKLLLILLVISAALNVVLGGVLYKNMQNKNKKLKDGTPMVNYKASEDDK